MTDRGYINLIRHLTRTTSTLPLETLQASVAHYLARPPIPVPGSPTPLAATVIGSPFFRPYIHHRLSALLLAFRHAVHIRVRLHMEEADQNLGSLLSRGVNVPARLAKWCRAILEGFSGSAAVVRLACISGLLLGLEDWESDLHLKDKEARVRAKVEEEVILALAEVVDLYALQGSGWETDFKRAVDAKGEEEDPLALALLLASQCASFIAPTRLQALPLTTAVDVLTSTIYRSFQGGAFLTNAPRSMVTNMQGKLAISPTSTFAKTAQSLAGSTHLASMGSLARFTAFALTVLVESRPESGWEVVGRTLLRLQSLTEAVEKDWMRCPLAGVSQDADLADDNSRALATATWTTLKTLLFTTLMMSQSILSSLIFVPYIYRDRPSSPSSSSPSLSISPYSLALGVLRTLSHLSFVMPQFGGVASTSEGGFPELKRAFYMALDVLSASESEARQFLEQLGNADDMVGKGKAAGNLPRTLLDAKKSFALACAEQLVPVLSEEVIQSEVYPLCLPHLWDPSHRETYESSHSVMLAIFASYSQNASYKRLSSAEPPFAEKIVPMYAQCLVENSSDGRLSTLQLCLAYAALVRGASSFGYTAGPSAPDDASTQADSTAWYCIEVLLDAIRHAHAAPVRATLPYSPDGQTLSSSSSSAAAAAPDSPSPSEHLHRLQLALIATVPTVSLALLPRLLIEVKAIVMSVSVSSSTTTGDMRSREMREELVQALFKAILQDIGDAEKEYAITWWYENREELVNQTVDSRHLAFARAETAAPDLVSRL